MTAPLAVAGCTLAARWRPKAPGRRPRMRRGNGSWSQSWHWSWRQLSGLPDDARGDEDQEFLTLLARVSALEQPTEQRNIGGAGCPIVRREHLGLQNAADDG